MLHDFFRWIQETLGATASAESWSQQFRGSLNLWGITEGTHVLTLMVFAGSIWLVDLRLMGVAFKSTPFSKLNDKVLPYTVVSFAVLIVTGIALFLAKPVDYYHNVWFRAKMIFLIIAALNIFWFHVKVQKNEAEWDEADKPPTSARLSGAISLSSWVIVIILGRFIAYNWYDCGKPLPGFVNWFAECASTPSGIVTADAAPPLVFPASGAESSTSQLAQGR
ncbi:MAG: hypothetical protein GC155_03915 [Alphaproteobacteria bacterium]|nr:hypothetical protein [Alphaproteobacteria bacterium]